MKTKKERKYHYFYKITNTINNHFYYGIHSTDNLDDGYMGSGSRLNYAYTKYGIENFTKEILKFFDSRKECSDYEAEVVNETLVEDPDCYNVILGGDNGTTYGTATVKDKNGNILQVPCNDKRILSGELKGISYGFTNCIDTVENKYVQIPNELFDKNRYVGLTTGKILCLDTLENKRVLIDKSIFEKNKNRYKFWLNTNHCFKDKNNNIYWTDDNDERVLNGELVYFWKGRKHSDKTKDKMKQTYKNINHQQGEKNSQYGTCWIMKDGISKKIKKDELETYISLGWIKGRICKK
jgi:hypothetical protein